MHKELEIVLQRWSGRMVGKPQYILWNKLMRLRPDLKQLTSTITEGVKQIQIARQHLEQAEKEQILQQKAKGTWLQLGDGNNLYFHVIVKGKNKQIGIQQLEDSQGHLLTEHKEIEVEVLHFYQGLVGKAASNLKHVDIVALGNGKQLEEEYKQDLIKKVTDKEIWEALKGVGDNKAPGCD
ncbi:uncharacterized protein LOC131651189 [Vicia villosa]|uniref:uncharacterized protein LOC131651189 n=1 Tax=Vicia villosa TaxID=3911 RepID=UPI00273CE420|nr:uncharacterized protein LOC131651189 [Vicia villosa]